jgi:hypothetical protein
LERGRFIWPSPASGVVATKAAELVERLADETTRRLRAFA